MCVILVVICVYKCIGVESTAAISGGIIVDWYYAILWQVTDHSWVLRQWDCGCGLRPRELNLSRRRKKPEAAFPHFYNSTLLHFLNSEFHSIFSKRFKWIKWIFRTILHNYLFKSIRTFIMLTRVCCVIVLIRGKIKWFYKIGGIINQTIILIRFIYTL